MRYLRVAKELEAHVGERIQYVFGHIRGIGDYEFVDEALGKVFDTIPVHPWQEVHPTVTAVCTTPSIFTEFVISRLIRLMAERYLLYASGRIKIHLIVPRTALMKMVANPGDPAYCKTSVLLSIFTDLEVKFHISPDDLYPPKYSQYTLVVLTPKVVPLIGADFDMYCLEYILRQIFLRRQTPLKAIVKCASLFFSFFFFPPGYLESI